MRNVLWLSLLLLIAGCTPMSHQQGPAVSRDPAKWFSCQKASDCVLLSGSSCTSPVGINAMFVGAYNQAHANDKQCGPAGLNLEQGVAKSLCIEKSCVVLFNKKHERVHSH
jgi:hypothetical protein